MAVTMAVMTAEMTAKRMVVTMALMMETLMAKVWASLSGIYTCKSGTGLGGTGVTTAESWAGE
jgi:hypothetical protein